MGGYENVWPFFIHEDYGKGTSIANISSFEKCHLSGSDQFDIRLVQRRGNFTPLDNWLIVSVMWKCGALDRSPTYLSEKNRNDLRSRLLTRSGVSTFRLTTVMSTYRIYRIQKQKQCWKWQVIPCTLKRTAIRHRFSMNHSTNDFLLRISSTTIRADNFSGKTRV